MSNFTKADIVLKPTEFLNYYLTGLHFGATNIQTMATTGYYQLSYDSTTSSNSYQATYYNHPTTNSNAHYKLTNLYFYQLIHNNITGITNGTGRLDNIIGELVLELNNSSDSTKLYLCFLIQSVTSKGTDDYITKQGGSISQIFDNIISDPDNKGTIFYKSDVKTTSSSTGKATGLSTISPSSDGTIPRQDGTGCIIYSNTKNSSNNTVVVYLKPITVSNPGFISFISGSTIKDTTTLFDIYPQPITSSGDSQTTANSQILSNPSNMSPSQQNSVKTTTTTDGSTSTVDEQIYIDCNPTADSNGDAILDSELAYNIPLNSTLMQDIQHSSMAQLSSNFLFFGFVVFVAYMGIPRFYNMAICDKMSSNEDKISAKAFIMMYLLIICVVLFYEGQQNGNMTELLAGSAFVFFTILTYILISNEENREGVTGSFNLPQFIGFLTGVLKHLIGPNCLPMIIVLWIILLIILVCLAFIPGQKSNLPKDDVYVEGASITRDQFRDYFCWIGLLVIPTIVGTMTWITS